MKSLMQKVAMVTGAGSGIGRATAVMLAEAGCYLVLNDINPCKLAQTEELVQSHTRVISLCGDMTDQAQVNRLSEAAFDEFGCVDVLINNAGMAMGGFIETVPVAEWERLMRLNFWAYVYTTQAILPQMLKRQTGHLVYVSSISGLLTSPNSLPYSTSKFAVVALAESVAAHVQPMGVGVSLVCPGTTQTEIAKNGRYFFHDSAESAQAQNWFARGVKSGMSATAVAGKIVQAIENETYLVVTHHYTRPLMAFRVLFPNSYLKISSWFHKRELEKAALAEAAL